MPEFSAFLEMPEWIMEGLEAGRYEASGGTIKIVEDGEREGQIVALLMDSLSGDLPEELVDWFAPARGSVTLGVCAVHSLHLESRLGVLQERLAEVQSSLGEGRAHLEGLVRADLPAAIWQVAQVEKSDDPEESEVLAAAIHRFTEVAGACRRHFDDTPDHRRDELLLCLQALSVALVGRLHCHYLRVEWPELAATAAEAEGAVIPRARRLLSLSLGCGPDYDAWKEDPARGGSLPDETRAAAALYLHPALQDWLPVYELAYLHGKADPEANPSMTLERLRLLLPRAFSDTQTTHFGADLEMTRLKALAPDGVAWTRIPDHENFSEMAREVLNPAFECAGLIDAFNSYSEQYELLRDSDVSAPDLAALREQRSDPAQPMYLVDVAVGPDEDESEEAQPDEMDG